MKTLVATKMYLILKILSVTKKYQISSKTLAPTKMYSNSLSISNIGCYQMYQIFSSTENFNCHQNVSKFPEGFQHWLLPKCKKFPQALKTLAATKMYLIFLNISNFGCYQNASHLLQHWKFWLVPNWIKFPSVPKTQLLPKCI